MLSFLRLKQTPQGVNRASREGTSGHVKKCLMFNFISLQSEYNFTLFVFSITLGDGARTLF